MANKSSSEALARREGRDHMDRGFGAFLPAGALQRLAIDGDHISDRPGQGRDPSDEAALEFLGVKRREDVAEVIMRGSAVAKRSEPTQKIELLLPEPGDVRERLGSRQHRKQAQQQNLLERIQHLAGLARVGQIPEMIQKNDRFAECPEFRRRIPHGNPPPIESEDQTDSALYALSGISFIRLPCNRVESGLSPRLGIAYSDYIRLP